MGSHHPFGHLKHKLWSKKSRGVKLAIWLPTIKSWESTQFSNVQEACNIPLERSQLGLQLFFKCHYNQRSAHEVMGPQSHRNPNSGNFGTSIWGQNAIWMWPPWRDIENTIRGKVVASPKSRPWWVLWVWGCPWLVLAPKLLKNYALNNVLFGLCRSKWVNKLFIISS
jgi:hypothetical protein